MKRSEAREWAFKLIFESQFHPELTFGELYEKQNNRPMTDDQTEFLRDMIESIWEEQV